MYDVICVVLCVFAVFGAYIALRIAAALTLRGLNRRVGREDGRRAACAGCAKALDCPEKRTAGSNSPPEANSGAERD